MNAGNTQRLRGPPNGAGLGPGVRPVQDQRNGSSMSSASGLSTNHDRNAVGSQMSRAEKFEDEKRRIIETCFVKKEPDGSISESYITHIRIDEDAAHPSSPPPRETPPDNKKPRVIIVAVRKSGRVRMHKAKENANGTFSIGKSWVLDDLSAIESFNGAIPRNPEEQANKQRAGSTGFIVTVQKPYYWNAHTEKEKTFFIFSLIKIFKKYTGGRVPELIGFSTGELEQLGGGPAVQNASQPPSQSSPSGPPGQRKPSQEPPGIREPREVNAPPEVSRERRPRPSHERPSQERANQVWPAPDQPPQDRQLYSQVAHPLRTAPSSDRIHMPGSFPSTDSVHDPNQQPQPRRKRSESPAVLQQPNFRRPGPSESTDSFKSGQESFASRSSNERPKPNGSYSSSSLVVNSGDERPLTAVRDNLGPSPLSQDPTLPIQIPPIQSSPLNFNPQPEERRPSPFNSQQGERRPSQASSRGIRDMRNDHMRDHSASSRGSNRSARGPPSIHPSESGADNMSAETRPTTASSHDVQSSQPFSQDVKTPLPPANDERTAPPQPAPTQFPPTPPPETPPPLEEVHRPGLGPMIKSKKSTVDVANKFRKAATAHNAFKARSGGGVEKLQEDNTTSGDGITGVFQAPSLLRAASQDDAQPVTPKEPEQVRPSTPEAKKELPSVTITTSPLKAVTPAAVDPTIEKTIEEKTIEPEMKPPVPEKAQEERRKKRQSDHSAKYAKVLGINPSLLEGRTFEIETVLNDFGWGEDRDQKTTFEELETSLRKELARVEAGSWLGAVENNDDRTVAVSDMLDRVIAECDELDGLLTLYNVELGTLSEDVAYIEAQSQGLQVQTANQKLLQTELQNLLKTISISPSQLQVLKDASLTKTRGIQEVESTLAQLYSAMSTIDPKLRQHEGRPMTADQASLRRSSSTGYDGRELSSMHAVREKRERYRMESVDFIQRLKQYMSIKFRETEAQTIDALEKSRTSKGSSIPPKLDHHLRDRPKKDLWLYSPLMLFAREIESSEWEELIRMYEGCAKKPYQDEFRDHVFACKRVTRKPAGDEDVLFTTHVQEKEAESLVGRKLTVKRSRTVRADGSSRMSSGDKHNDGKVAAYEAFAGALSEMSRLIFVEQNFIVDLFHASSLDSQDFVDAVTIDIDQRQAGESIEKKPFDPDRNMARKVLGAMEEIYSFWSNDIQSLVDWAVKQDALNSVGVLYALESQLLMVEETNQEFLAQSITKIHDRVITQFTRFVEEQIRGIEDTKVKIKKRKGVIAFMKTFPNFSTALENMLPPTRNLDHLPVRSMVNDAYQQINKAMFESLKFIAKESPTATQAQTSTTGDPEDKEALNYHILLIENMNHYIEEVAVRNNSVLETWILRARAEMNEHMELYLAAVIRRPLGKLLDFLESTESLIRSNSGSPASIATRASHSRSTFKKILSSYDAKEIRRGIDTLRKRVDKHFGEGDDTPGLSRELITKVCKECEARYLDINERVQKVVKDVYEGNLEVEWRREDVVGAFRR